MYIYIWMLMHLSVCPVFQSGGNWNGKTLKQKFFVRVDWISGALDCFCAWRNMDDSCAVCAETLEWVAYGACGHRDVCSTCVARLRFICNDSRCCICKTENAVVFVTKVRMGPPVRVIGEFLSVFTPPVLHFMIVESLIWRCCKTWPFWRSFFIRLQCHHCDEMLAGESELYFLRRQSPSLRSSMASSDRRCTFYESFTVELEKLPYISILYGLKRWRFPVYDHDAELPDSRYMSSGCELIWDCFTVEFLVHMTSNSAVAAASVFVLSLVLLILFAALFSGSRRLYKVD